MSKRNRKSSMDLDLVETLLVRAGEMAIEHEHLLGNWKNYQGGNRWSNFCVVCGEDMLVQIKSTHKGNPPSISGSVIDHICEPYSEKVHFQ